jgi:hypothetical protein
MKHHFPALLAVLLATAALPSRASVIDVEWAADGSFQLQRSVDPGKLLEACARLPAGARVDWAYEAGMPLDFNIHYHVGKDVVYPKQLKRAGGAKGTLAVDLEQDYCWMWSNKNKAAVSLSLTLRR